ncbi:MAG TPA: sigma 54-interacting transcriptional regulator, partial [Alphaproteobacteria bacterium]|nr:sigma 54-interacting transcriptional regulator [Alphaproteobacteria bacterium]
MAEQSIELPPLLGEARSFVTMLEHASRVAPLDRPLLVIGERGTGKELVGARLHYLSRRWDRPFVKVNCAALSEDLLESELFGHEAGAFTGAVRRHIGRFERADSGTLFLDEIASASLRVQEKVLRVVEYGEFERVGGGGTQRVDVRVIGATNLDLPREVEAGRFRADLLDRLAFDVITLPPLRERPEDIRLLAEHFGQAMAREMGADAFPGFAPEAMALIERHTWPGNVRELKNAVERAVAKAPQLDRPLREVELDPFRSPFRPLAGSARPQEAPSAPMPAAPPGAPAPGIPGTDGEPFDFAG